jgi:hypothetical protein
MLSAASRLLVIASFIWAIFPTQAYAYLDPGTVSLVVQTVIVFFVFLGVFIRSQSRRVKELVKGLSRRLRG